jgi:hypothetical protein
MDGRGSAPLQAPSRAKIPCSIGQRLFPCWHKLLPLALGARCAGFQRFGFVVLARGAARWGEWLGDSGRIGFHWNGARRSRQVATANGMRSTDAEKRRTLDDGSRQALTKVTAARNQRAARRSPSANQRHACQNGGGICASSGASVSGFDRRMCHLKIPNTMLRRDSATNGRKQRSNAISPGRRRRLGATCLVFIHRDCEVRRCTCMAGGKVVVEARAVTPGAVRCSAWLGDFIGS